MNEKYWEKFYRTKRITRPSDFAKFCLKYLPKKQSKIVDLGCGNGRDSYFFAKKGHIALGIDKNNLPKDHHRATFIKADVFSTSCYASLFADVLYARFLLHAVHILDVHMIIYACIPGTYFMAEFRCCGDKPKIYKNHYRNFVNPEWLLCNMLAMNYEIIYCEKGYGFAKYKGEDPLVGRIIGRKK